MFENDVLYLREQKPGAYLQAESYNIPVLDGNI